MKKTLFAALSFAAVFATSCKKDIESTTIEKSGTPTPLATVTLSGVITAGAEPTINPGDAVFIDGIVYVDNGATLNIPAGTIITGKTTAFGVAPDPTNLSNNKGTLLVQKGGKINAIGTPSAPIIWTSANSIGSRNPGDWGGLVLCGDAPIVTSTGAITNNFEAFAALPNGRNGYGGSNVSSNSGVVTYNRFEFGGGTVTAPNAEVNGLTLCGVGNGTVLNHIEVLNSGDDGFEWFGGTVNADHLLSFSNKDDDFDFDENYNGNLQFIFGYRSDLADNSGSELIELDNNNGSPLFFFGSQTRTRPFISNATLIGPASTVARVNPGGTAQAGRFDGGVYVRRGGRIILLNSIIAAEGLPCAFATTPSTSASFGPIAAPPTGGSLVAFNIFQTTSATPVVEDNNEGNPILPGGTSPGIVSNLGANSNVLANSNTVAGIGLGGLFQNLPSSQSFSGGIDLAAAGVPGFVGTTQCGAVLSNDVWTSGSWISIALN
jgi:hypothetical protein